VPPPPLHAPQLDDVSAIQARLAAYHQQATFITPHVSAFPAPAAPVSQSLIFVSI
jgi:hypothetical protein